MKKPRRSKRFEPSPWSERLIPILLILLTLALLITLVILALSLFGLIPEA